MAIKTVAVQVSANTFELVEALGAMAASCKKALSDGFQPTDDLPDLVAAAAKNLIPQLGKLDEVAGELGESKEAFAAAIAVALKNAISDYLKA